MKSTEKTKNVEMESYVAKAIPEIWKRVEEVCEERKTKISKVCKDIGMNASSVYATIRQVNNNEGTVKDFELYLIVAICEYFNVELDWIIHGIKEDTEAKEKANNMFNTLKQLSGGSMKTMLLAMLPFFTKEEQEALLVDIKTRL